MSIPGVMPREMTFAEICELRGVDFSTFLASWAESGFNPDEIPLSEHNRRKVEEILESDVFSQVADELHSALDEFKEVVENYRSSQSVLDGEAMVEAADAHTRLYQSLRATQVLALLLSTQIHYHSHT